MCNNIYTFIGLLVIVVAVVILVKIIVGHIQNAIEYGDFTIIKKVIVSKDQICIMLKERDFEKFLEPGKYWLWDLTGKKTFNKYNLNEPEFEGNLLNVLYKNYPAECEKHLLVADVGDHEVGLVYYDEKLKSVLPPGSRKGYWKGLIDTKVEIINIEKDYRVPEDKKSVVLRTVSVASSFKSVEIKEYEKALLFVNGEYKELLGAGFHIFWNFNTNYDIKCVDLRVMPIDVNGQEIMTKDKVSLRVNLSADYKVKDPEKAVLALFDYKGYIYKELQYAAREVLASVTLDELLSKKDELAFHVFERANKNLPNFDIELDDLGIKDIILPGDMRDLMNQVVEAQKQSEANLIRRREEIAATRSLQNTSKMMENNPMLIRLKELEALEKITAKIDKVTVLGGLDGLLTELVKIKGQ